MKKKWDVKDESFFGIGVYQPKTEHNIGTLWRSAMILGASFIFIIDGKYKPQTSDTQKTWSKTHMHTIDGSKQFTIITHSAFDVWNA